MSLDLKRVDVFSAHCRACPTCSRSRYAYIDCAAGGSVAATPLVFLEDA